MVVDCGEQVTEVAVESLPVPTLVQIIYDQHRTIENMGRTIAELTKTNASQQTTIAVLSMQTKINKSRTQVQKLKLVCSKFLQDLRRFFMR